MSIITNTNGTKSTNLPLTGDMAIALAQDISLLDDLIGTVAEQAPLASPAFTGAPTAPTPATDNESTIIATTAFVHAALTTLGGGGSTPTLATVLAAGADTGRTPIAVNSNTVITAFGAITPGGSLAMLCRYGGTASNAGDIALVNGNFDLYGNQLNVFGSVVIDNSGNLHPGGGGASFSSDGAGGINGPGGTNISSSGVFTGNGSGLTDLPVGIPGGMSSGGYSATDSSGNTSLDWGSRCLVDSDGTTQLTWTPSGLFDSSGCLLANQNWVENQGYVSGDSAGIPGGMSNGGYSATDNSCNTSLDWENRCLRDANGDTSLDWGNRYLIDSNNTTSLDWSNRCLSDSDGTTSLDWGNRCLFDYNSISLDWGNRYLIDSIGTGSLDWNNRYLLDTATENSLDWNNRCLSDSNSTTSLDWNNRCLRDANSDTSLDWNNRCLIDTSGTPSLDWDNRRLFDSNYSTSIDWENYCLVANCNGVLSWSGGNISVNGDCGWCGAFTGSVSPITSIQVVNGIVVSAS